MKMVKNVFADYFSVDSYDGKVARLEHGNLGLRSAPVEEKLTNGHAELHQTNGMSNSTSGGQWIDCMAFEYTTDIQCRAFARILIHDDGGRSTKLCDGQW